MTYLVTGANGGFGSYALEFLQELVPTAEIYALVRSEEKGAELKAAGFNIRVGDYADPAAMKTAMQGIQRLLFVSGAPGNRQVEHANVVEAAKAAGVSYIAYTSLAAADKSSSALAVDHVFTEKLIAETNISHTFLRNNWYLENELPLIGAALAGGTFAYAAGEGKTGWALKREYAEVAAKALAGADYSEVLELSGTPVNYDVLAAAVQKAADRKFEVVAASDQAFVENLTASGLPHPVAEMFLSFQHDIQNGQLAVSSADFERALGKPLTGLTEAVKELLG